MIIPVKIEDIPEDILKRRFGVNPPIIDFFEVGFMGSLGSILECITEEGDSFYLWGINKDDTWYWGMTLKDSVENLLGSSLVRSDFELVGEKMHLKIKDLNRLNIDSTNIHYLIETIDGKKFHVKEYTRKNRGLLEIELGRVLSKKNLFPRVEKSLVLKLPGFKRHGILGFYNRMENLKNLDELSFQYLGAYLFQESEEGLDSYLDLISRSLRAVNDFHSATSEINSEEYSIHTLGERIIPLVDNVLEKIGLAGQEKITDIIGEKIKGEEIIHGDLWWRQIELDERGRLLILDLEDVVKGSNMFDFASFYNGIDNQLEYLRTNNSEKISSRIEELRTRVYSLFEGFGDDFWVFVLARAIQEYSYSLSHFGNNWLTSFLQEKIIEVSQKVINF